jgi:transcriptional regulator with XRE-family HTH domain
MRLIEFLRLQRGLTKGQTARLVRMLPNDYSLLERGLEPPTASQAKRLTDTFGYDAELLTIDVGRLVEIALSRREAIR